MGMVYCNGVWANSSDNVLSSTTGQDGIIWRGTRRCTSPTTDSLFRIGAKLADYPYHGIGWRRRRLPPLQAKRADGAHDDRESNALETRSELGLCRKVWEAPQLTELPRPTDLTLQTGSPIPGFGNPGDGSTVF